MPAQKRYKTKYPGVYYIEGSAISSNKPEKIFYVMYRKGRHQIHEKAGRQYQDDMTAARAAQIRSDKISGKQLSNRERRESERTLKQTQDARWTIDKLAIEYFKVRPDNKSKDIDNNRYDKYLKDEFGSKEPVELAPLDLDRLRIRLLKKLSPQSVKHILNLLTWIINFGVKKNLSHGISFQIQKPAVYNLQTEDLTDDQLKRLLKAIEQDSNIQVKNLMKLALFTGMRRGELFKLQWSHIDFDRGFIHIKDPKGGPDQVIPLNDSARKILESHPREKSPFVFPGLNGRQRVSAQVGVNKIKTRAGLPDKFRPLHGLRHVFASMMASSGQVDMYALQRLLTHKDPRMTQRYAHLHDEALKKASNLAGKLISNVLNENGGTKQKGIK